MPSLFRSILNYIALSTIDFPDRRKVVKTIQICTGKLIYSSGCADLVQYAPTSSGSKTLVKKDVAFMTRAFQNDASG